MRTSKIEISIDRILLTKLDRMVADQAFSSRSQAIQKAVEEKINRLERSRLAKESSKLNADFEQSMAEEGILTEEAEWPEY